MRELNARKLETNWEGPYRITKVVRDGVYKLLKVINRVPELRPWNVMHLKKYLRQLYSTAQSVASHWVWSSKLIE